MLGDEGIATAVPDPAAAPGAEVLAVDETPAPEPPAPPAFTARPGVELWLVLGLSLGQSAVYALLNIWNRLTVEVALNQQSSSLNNSVTPDRPWLDLAYQLANIAFPLVPALLALYLLGRSGRELIGLTHGRIRPLPDLGWAAALAAGIGLPGLAFLAGARLLGLNTHVVPSNLAAAWWTVPVLLLAAAMNGILEEVVVIGFFYARCWALRWNTAVIVLASALIRGSYHLYQGFGSFAGNAIMGVVFGLFFVKTKRVAPLILAHFLMDAAVFVGYPLLAPWILATPWLAWLI
ncbi:MAG: CPBP family intramembrane metalloprotease [Propionibacteriaceae bacterium]|nr:CPBP family intramembrane metalloprotease [Propionibacteriaceae bacterium]